MKRYHIVFAVFVLLMPLGMVSCSEEDNVVEEFPNWQAANADSMARLFAQAEACTDGTWKVIKNFSLEDGVAADPTNSIVVHVLETEYNGDPADDKRPQPMYTDSVLVNYSGRLLASTSWPAGYQFDSNYEGAYDSLTAKPARMYVGGVIDGFSTALQYMHNGDRWEVYIPYQLGYGALGSGAIPGYSTLVFTIELIAFYRADETPEPWKAPAGRWITE